MKATILVILFLLCSQILSQIDSQDKIKHRDFIKERKPHSSIPLDQRESSFEANIFPNNDSRRTVNKTTLNDEFRLTEQIEQRWDSTCWVNMELGDNFGIYWGGRHTYIYNESNNLIEDLWQDWDGTNWVNFRENTYAYDSNNNMSKDLLQEWYNMSWVNKWKNTYTYDVNNNMIEDLRQSLHDSNWVNLWKKTNSYDDNNNVIEHLWQGFDDANWVNWWKNTYTYDINNNMIEDSSQDWSNSTWVNYKKGTYTYDRNNNRIEDLFQNWDGSNWETWGKITYTYDTNNNMIEFDENWWAGKHTFTYDVSNNMIEDLVIYWDGTSWGNSTRTIYTYKSIATKIEQLTEVIESYSLSNNYPNPFNPSTTINYQIPEQIRNDNSSGLTSVRLNVFDILGREVVTLVNQKQNPGSYEVTWDGLSASGGQVPSGVYFYQLTNDNFVETKKMILLR